MSIHPTSRYLHKRIEIGILRRSCVQIIFSLAIITIWNYLIVFFLYFVSSLSEYKPHESREYTTFTIESTAITKYPPLSKCSIHNYWTGKWRFSAHLGKGAAKSVWEDKGVLEIEGIWLGSLGRGIPTVFLSSQPPFYPSFHHWSIYSNGSLVVLCLSHCASCREIQ